MSKEKIYIFDTTLRDGAQTEGVNFSIDDKIKIAKRLSELGVDYLEGGWPGANTLDTTFFNNPPKLIKESQNTLNKWYGQFEKTNSVEIQEDTIHPLLEDLNTPEYISKLHLLYDESSKGNKSSKVKFLSACKLIGLLEEDKESWEIFKKSKSHIDENFINQKIKDRNIAREEENYELADNIRKELENNGVIIEDKKDQTNWKYK